MKTFSIKPSLEEKKIHISCPLCGSEQFLELWDCGSFAFKKCISCSLILQNPQPVFEALDKRYDDEYFKYEQSNDDIFFDLMKKSLSDVNFSAEYKISDGIKSFLDIGCATGLLVEYMQNNEWKSQGVELCGPAAQYGVSQRGVNIFAGTFEQANFEDETFDVIHCSHLIEHLNCPNEFIDNVYKKLKTGGLFLCTTPNSSGLQAKIYGEKWRSSIGDHMFLFSKKTLVKMMKKRNFQIKRIKTWGGLGLGYGPVWLKKLLDNLAKKLSFGDVMIISARKN